MTESPEDPWIPPAGAVVPDFVIAGAMKSGTSTLQDVLRSHPDLFIPEREIHFFDQDDLLTHPDFNTFDGTAWSAPDVADNPAAWWAWYAKLFAAARPGQLLGDYSTTYMASPLFSSRLARLPSRPRVVISLRHPTSRCYSQYWHMLRTGRATYSFEDTLRFEPQAIVSPSLYLDHFSSLLHHVARRDVHVLLFEDLLVDAGAVICGVCEHLGIDPHAIGPDAFAVNANPARVPRFPAMQYWKNRLLRDAGNWRYLDRGPAERVGSEENRPFFPNLLNRAHNLLNPTVVSKPPPMKPGTRAHLDRYFRSRLAGIDELLGMDLLAKWFGE